MFNKVPRSTITIMKIVCASSVLFGREAFSTLGEVVVLPDRAITRNGLQDADVLIVRSKTTIDASLLEGTPVGFVGTATAGTDHMDLNYLAHSPLAWSAAPGCNANSVAEYFTAALLSLAHRSGYVLENLVVGVIGVGQVGGRVVQKAEAMGLTVLRNDPPLQVATGDTGFVPIEEVLRHADILTLHVPLTQVGTYPTRGMVNCNFLAGAQPGCIFINAARGEVMDTEALLFALEQNLVSHAVLDVWENEPFISTALLQKAALGTPHIAGYSFEGRLNGTVQMYREACHYFEVEPVWVPDESAFPRAPEVRVDARGKSDETALWDVVRAAYDIEADDRALRTGIAYDEAAWGTHFDALRRDYPPRREFPAVNVVLEHASPELRAKVGALGFRVSAE